MKAAITPLFALISLITFSSLQARADFAISLGEQKARPHEDNLHGRFMRFLYDQGSGDPGHAVLYVSDLCNDDSYFRVRMCNENDKNPGVYISFIAHLSGDHSWIAVPPSMYLYGVKNIEDRPLFGTTFNRDYYTHKESQRPSDLVSQDPEFKESRFSSLDMVRREYLLGENDPFKDGALNRVDKGKTVGATDKVNLYVMSERDVYNIVIHGDTRAQAQKLLEHFQTTENQIAPTDKHNKDEKYEGSFGWWQNCAWTVNRWVTIAFGSELKVSPSFFEFEIENPRHYGRVLLTKIDALKKQGKFSYPVSIDYYPKVTSDRGRSTGYGSPADGLWNPLTIEGAAIWYSHFPVAVTAYVANWKNIHFRMGKQFDKEPALAIAQLQESLRSAQTDEERASLTAQIDAERAKMIGSKTDWETAETRTKKVFSDAATIPGLPAELSAMLAKSEKPGKFSQEVAMMMAYRSQAIMDADGDSHRFQFRFKDVSSGKPAQDEGVRYETAASRGGLLAANNPLSVMLTLAVLDDYMSASQENRPSWPEMQDDLSLAEQVVAKAKAQ